VRLFPADWQGFLEDVALWAQLSIPARTAFLDGMRPGLGVEDSSSIPALDDLRDAGLLAAGASPGYLTVDPRYGRFHHLLKALERIRVFEEPGFDVLRDYLSEHFSQAERSRLHESLAFHPNDFGRIASLVTTVEWLEEFMSRDRIPPAAREDAGAHARALAGARQMLGFLMEQRALVPLRDLEEYFPGMDRKASAAALRLGVQSAVFFLALRRSDREPLVGIWPSAARRLRKAAVALAPGPVEASRRFLHPLFVEDMTTILLAAAAEPVPVRRSDDRPFSRFEDEVAGMLLSLPAWVEEFSGLTAPMRTGAALDGLRRAGYVLEEKDQENLRLRPSGPGRQWVQEALGRRREEFLSRIARAGSGPRAAGVLAFLLGSRIEWAEAGEEILQALVQAFTSAPRSSFIRFKDFAGYQAAIANPLVPLRERGGGSSLWAGTDALPTDEALEELWQSVLHTYLCSGLIALGGAEAGLTAQGEPCFRITGHGRALLGHAETVEEEPEQAADIVVQPTFEVVFLAPCPAAEAEIARFSQRIGSGVGTLFRITRDSILRAAACGLPEERLVGALARFARNTLPPNVETEIKGWFARGR
jgi:hypothetical protein